MSKKAWTIGKTRRALHKMVDSKPVFVQCPRCSTIHRVAAGASVLGKRVICQRNCDYHFQAKAMDPASMPKGTRGWQKNLLLEDEFFDTLEQESLSDAIKELPRPVRIVAETLLDLPREDRLALISLFADNTIRPRPQRPESE